MLEEGHREGGESRENPVFHSIKGNEVVEPNGRRAAVRCQGHLRGGSVWGKGETPLRVASLARLP